MHISFRNSLYQVFVSVFQNPGIDATGISASLRTDKKDVRRQLDQLDKGKLVAAQIPEPIRVMNQSGLYVALPVDNRWSVIPSLARSLIGATAAFDKKFPVISLITGDTVHPVVFFTCTRKNTADGIVSMARQCGIVNAANHSVERSDDCVNVERQLLDRLRRLIETKGISNALLSSYPIEQEIIPPITPVTTTSTSVDVLLSELRNATCSAARRRIRSRLRAAGHRGGLSR